MNKGPIEGLGWVETEIRKRTRTIAVSVALDVATITHKLRRGLPSLTVKFDIKEQAWILSIIDLERSPKALQISTLKLPGYRVDRNRVLIALAKEYLS